MYLPWNEKIFIIFIYGDLLFYFWVLSCSVEYLVEFLSDWFNWKFLAILQSLSYATKLSEVRLDRNSSQGIYKGKVYEMRNHVTTLQ